MAAAVRARAVCPLEQMRANSDAVVLAVMAQVLVREARMGVDRMLEGVGNAAHREGDWVFQLGQDRKGTRKKAGFKGVGCFALSGLLF